MTKHDGIVALTGVHADRIDFEEDQTFLEMMETRIFRWANERDDAKLTELPDVEKDAQDAIDEEFEDSLDKAVTDLDTAKHANPVKADLTQWKDGLRQQAEALEALFVQWKERLSVGQAQ